MTISYQRFLNNLEQSSTIQANKLLMKSLSELFGSSDMELIFQEARIKIENHNLIDANYLSGKNEVPVQELRNAYDNLFGEVTSKGIAHRVGRIIFKYVKNKYQFSIIIANPPYNTYPIKKKIAISAEQLANVICDISPHNVNIEETKDQIIISINNAFECRNIESHGPYCHMTVGFIKEALSWMSGGKDYIVAETGCCAMGHPNCTFTINTIPCN
jgi:predicted hydrocarbon binding protein